MLFRFYSHAQLFRDDAPDVSPSTEYCKERRQQKAKKTSENNSNEQVLQTTSHSSAQVQPTTAEHDVVTNTSTNTSDEHTLSITVPSRPDGSIHCISNVSAMPTDDIETVKTESHVRRPSLTIPIALCLIVVATLVNIQFAFTAFVWTWFFSWLGWPLHFS